MTCIGDYLHGWRNEKNQKEERNEKQTLRQESPKEKMITSLSIILIASCLMQTPKSNFNACLPFASTIAASWACGFTIDNDWYYIANVALDFSAILMICKLKSKLCKYLVNLVMFSICINTVGLISYHAQITPNVYYYMFLAWYVSAILILTVKGHTQWRQLLFSGNVVYSRFLSLLRGSVL